MTIQDTSLKARTLRAIDLQGQGCFILDQRKELPLSSHESLSRLHYSRATDDQGLYFDYETEWGKFRFDPENRSLLVLRRGAPPDELLPQPKLALATATVHPGYVSIHNNGSSFDLDFQTRDKVEWDLLRMLNQTLSSEGVPVVVWQLDEAQEEKAPVICIASELAILFASSAIWDNDEQQLAAAQVFRLEREVWHEKYQGRTRQVVYGLTSLALDKTSPEKLLMLTPQYRGIENGLHYWRDVTLYEDGIRLTIGNSGHSMAILNNLKIGLCLGHGFDNLAKARRLFAAKPDLALELLTSA